MGLAWGLYACIQLYLCACIVWDNIALCQTIQLVRLCACMLALVYTIMLVRFVVPLRLPSSLLAVVLVLVPSSLCALAVVRLCALML